jgi:UDP-N-acetylglucosamine acyltransferase
VTQEIDPTARVHPGAKIGKNCRVGAFAVVNENVTLEDRVIVFPHAVIDGVTHIAEDCKIYPFASVGSDPQDLKYKGEKSRLFVGARTVIREGATLNTGTEGGGMETRVGADCLLMTGAHVGHDCRVGDRVILVNNATLAGHVTVEDGAVLGGLCAVHQFCRIGKGAMIGGMTGVENDVIPYGTVTGNRAMLRGLNLIGVERSGAPRERINELRAAYKQIFSGIALAGSVVEKAAQAKENYPDNMFVAEIADFLMSESKRRFVMPEQN